MSLLTDFTSNKYDALDFALLYIGVSTLSLIADHYLGGYAVAEWWLIFAVVMMLFFVKNRNKTNKK